MSFILLQDSKVTERGCAAKTTAESTCGKPTGTCVCKTDKCNKGEDISSGAIKPGMMTASATILFAAVARCILV